MNPKDHPNASVAMIAGLLIGQVIWILGYWHVTIPDSIQSGWTTLTIAALLYLGKRASSQHRATRRTVRRVRRARKTTAKGATP